MGTCEKGKSMEERGERKRSRTVLEGGEHRRLCPPSQRLSSHRTQVDAGSGPGRKRQTTQNRARASGGASTLGQAQVYPPAPNRQGTADLQRCFQRGTKAAGRQAALFHQHGGTRP